MSMTNVTSNNTLSYRYIEVNLQILLCYYFVISKILKVLISFQLY